MKIPIGIFFGGSTSARNHSLRSAQKVFAQLKDSLFEPLPILVDPFGQLILLKKGMPDASAISEFYPGNKYFSKSERAQFPVYPEQLGRLGSPEQRAMAEEVGQLLSPELISDQLQIAFLALPDVEQLQELLAQQQIPYTGESFELLDLLSDRYSLRLQLQKSAFPMPADHRLTLKDWQKSNLQALENSATIVFPLLLQPSRQFQAGRSSVITSKDGPKGLKRAVDMAFGQTRLQSDDWLDMNPIDRENFIRQLGKWSSGIGFPLELNTGTETIVFQRPAALLDYLKKTAPERGEATYIFRAQRAEEEILVSSLPEGTALSCLLIRQADGNWKAETLRYLGSSRAVVAGSEQFPVVREPVLRVSESMSRQVMDNCIELAKQISATSGIRIYGILSSEGELIPEEIQGFTGPEPEEEADFRMLNNFIIASIEARQAEQAEADYSSLLTTLSNAPVPAAIVAAPTPEPETKIEVAAPEPQSTGAISASPTIYQRELEKLKQEKAVTPDKVTITKVTDRDESPARQKWWEKLWESTSAFFTSRVFLRNLGAMALFGLLLFLLVNMGLRAYTKHGDTMQLEDYQGLLLEDARRKAAAKDLKMEVISRPFVLGKRPDEIFSQYPAPLSKVKENRTIFVSVYGGEGNEITLPAFTTVGDDITNYTRELKKHKVRLLVRDQVFDPKLAEGTILYLLVDGKKVTNTELRLGDVKVKEGDVVEAVVSTRESKIVDVPDLVCHTFGQAQLMIDGAQLVLGKVYGGSSDGDRNNYWVWKQDPEYRTGKMITKGESITVYLIPTKPEGCSGE